MVKLIFGISGVRGIVGETLTDKVANKLGEAFGNFIKMKLLPHNDSIGKIIVGMDKRGSSEYIKNAFVEGVLSKGIDTIDLGAISTPSLLFNIKKYNADGGAVITASHNPENWNGVKFADSSGIFLNQTEINQLYKIFNRDDRFAVNKKGRLTKSSDGIKNHICGALNIINYKKIRDKKFNVVIDCGMGVAEEESCILLQELGCNVIKIHKKREIEPTAASTIAVAEKLKELNGDIGFATDADGDRLCLITEKGEQLSEEYTLPIVASYILNSRKGYVVTNLSTSNMIDYVCKKNNCSLIRTKVGEINVVEKMIELNAVLGGEGNGGVIDPYFHLTRDAFLSMSRILEFMAISNKKLSQIVQEFPKYFIKKEKILYEKAIDFEKILSILPKGKMNFTDGLRIDFDSGWLHIRKSNTEPVIRIICETTDEKLTISLIEKIKICVV